MKEYIVESGDALYNENTGKAVFNLIVNGELIRCRDCKHMTERYDADNLPYWMCSGWHDLTDYDGFCHYGERKEK